MEYREKDDQWTEMCVVVDFFFFSASGRYSNAILHRTTTRFGPTLDRTLTDLMAGKKKQTPDNYSREEKKTSRSGTFSISKRERERVYNKMVTRSRSQSSSRSSFKLNRMRMIFFFSRYMETTRSPSSRLSKTKTVFV